LGLLAAGAAVLGLLAMAIGLTVAGGSYEPSIPGLPDPGPVVGWGLPILRMLTLLAGALTVGWLIGAAFLDPHGKGGVVSPTGRKDLTRTVVTSGIWAVLALLQMFFLLAEILGVGLDRAMSPDIAATYAWEVPQTRALAVMAMLAAIISVGALFTSTLGLSALWAVLAVGAVSLPALAGHGAGLGDHALALSSAIAHSAAATVWIGGLIVLIVHGLRRDEGFAAPGALRTAAERFGVAALVSVIILAATGAANAYTRLDTVDQLITTDYGLVTTAKIVLLVVLVLIAGAVRRRLVPSLETDARRSAFLRVAALETSLIVVAFGLGVALAVSPYPRVESLLPRTVSPSSATPTRMHRRPNRSSSGSSSSRSSSSAASSRPRSTSPGSSHCASAGTSGRSTARSSGCSASHSSSGPRTPASPSTPRCPSACTWSST